MHVQRRGFTLIEVALAVTVGLMILAASVYAYQQVNQSSKFASAKQMVATIQTNIGMEKFRNGRPEALADFTDNRDSANKPYWPGETGGAFPADPVMGVSTVTAYDSTLAAIDLGSGTPESSWDNPIFQTAGMGQGGWLYDPATGSFRINLSNKDHPSQRPSSW